MKTPAEAFALAPLPEQIPLGRYTRRDVFDSIEFFNKPQRKDVRNGMLSAFDFEQQHKRSCKASSKRWATGFCVCHLRAKW